MSDQTLDYSKFVKILWNIACFRNLTKIYLYVLEYTNFKVKSGSDVVSSWTSTSIEDVLHWGGKTGQVNNNFFLITIIKYTKLFLTELKVKVN